VTFVHQRRLVLAAIGLSSIAALAAAMVYCQFANQQSHMAPPLTLTANDRPVAALLGAWEVAWIDRDGNPKSSPLTFTRPKIIAGASLPGDYWVPEWKVMIEEKGRFKADWTIRDFSGMFVFRLEAISDDQITLTDTESGKVVTAAKLKQQPIEDDESVLSAE
jgi:hypothetical protein